jgi:peptidyl-prolyl cis-trans isomerase B (cyclophilin B)
MKTTTILIALTMLTTGLAGCTGGDPDAGGNDEIDAETLQNLQDFINGTMATEWINDRGDSGHYWNISLSDEEWLEVASAEAVMYHYHDGDDHFSSWTAMIVSDEGYIAQSGRNYESKSPIFGGNYSLCINWNDGVCYDYDRDTEYEIVEWSVIYRIHRTSGVNYYYTGSFSPNETILENQNITLQVSYVPSGSDEDGRVYGTIVIELFPNEAPLHVDSFVNHIESDAYNHTIFHRVIGGFVIQGGDIQNQDGTGGYAGDWYGYCNGEPATTCDTADMTIPSEADNGLTHGPGTLAMARSSDPDSGGSQFYIVPSGSTPSHLDGEYTVFGQVISGQEHVNAISDVDTGSSDVPIHDVIIEAAWVN